MKSLTLSQRMRGLLGLLVLAGTSWVSGAQAADNEITVPINRSELISLPADISEVIIANPEIADVYVHGKSKVSVIGRRVGATSLRVLDADSNDLRSVTVRVTYDLPAIRQALYQFFPYEDIAVQTVNNNLALTGMVSTPAVAQKAIRIANEFLIPSDEVRPRQEDFSPSGSLPGADSGVINMLKVTSGQQVMLRVRVGEIQRSTLKQLGFNNFEEATDGTMALSKLQIKPYKLIISDWNMQPMTGMELLTQVRAHPNLKNIPFIMVTAESKPENVIAAKKAGVNNYIVKPFNVETLKTKMTAVIGQF